MVTGRMPFGATNMSVLFRSIMTGSYPMPQAVSESLSGLIQSILVVQVSKRAKLTEIRDHEWMSFGGKLPLLELSAASDSKPRPEQISKEILNRLKEFGFGQSQVDEYVKFGVPGPVKTAVHLLKESSSPRVLPFFPDPQSLRTPRTQIYDQLSYNLSPATSPKETSLMEKIKLLQESQSIENREPLRTNGPPITATFLHDSNRQDTHLEILSKVLLEGGSIPRFEDEENDVMYARINLHKVPLGNLWDTSDPELTACFAESTESFPIDISVTTQPADKKFISVVRLLSKEVPEWVIQEFDQFCLELMKYVI
jgi:serine/threonine protein kinase